MATETNDETPRDDSPSTGDAEGSPIASDPQASAGEEAQQSPATATATATATVTATATEDGGEAPRAEAAPDHGGERASPEEQAPSPPRCSICGTLVRDGEPARACPECLQDYHLGCWDEIGGCATYGCKQAAVAEKKAPARMVGSGWGDEKECPRCGDSIASSLLVCHCGARFPWADTMTKREYYEWIDEERATATTTKVLVALFLVSLSGFGAPLSGPISAYYAHKNRRRLAGPNGVYLAMGYGSAALAAAYVGAALVLAFAW